MDTRGKEWMHAPRVSEEYISGVLDFLDKAFARAAHGDEILCPCKRCSNRYWYKRNVVYDHLISKGFAMKYDEWFFHGEPLSSTTGGEMAENVEVLNTSDDISGLLHNVFRGVEQEMTTSQPLKDSTGAMSADVRKFFKLIEEGKQELYPGCKKFSKLSFIIRLYLWKCIHGLSNESFTDLLLLLKEVFPEAKLPESYNQAKNIVVKDLGLDYKKIHACPNDCMLYTKAYEKANSCHVCGASRWKSNNGSRRKLTTALSKRLDGIPAKEKEEPSRAPLSDGDMFIVTRKKKEGKPQNERTAKIIAELEELQSQQTSQEGENAQVVDAYSMIMGPSHRGRPRFYGKGVCAMDFKKKEKMHEEYIHNQEEFRALEAKLEDEMQMKLDAQKLEMTQGFAMLLTHLQQDNPSLKIDTNVLNSLFLVAPSPRDAASAGVKHVQSSAGAYTPTNEDDETPDKEDA